MKAEALFRLVIALLIVNILFPENFNVSAANQTNAATAVLATADLQFLGQVGGVTQSVYIDGNLAFIGEGPRLSILDISNPGSPSVVGKTIPFSGVLEAVFASGTHAYVLAPDGLSVVDVSSPANPIPVGFYSTSGDTSNIGKKMFVSGNIAFIPASHNGLRLIDISDPTNPTEVGFYDTAGIARAVHVVGEFAYVADVNTGLYIVDVSDPSNPTAVGSYTATSVNDVFVVGNFAYVVGNNAGLRILDITDPTRPLVVGAHTPPNLGPVGVFVNGNYAYLANFPFGNFRIINVSNPTNPIAVASISDFFSPNSVYVMNNFAYVTDSNSAVGLNIFDVSNPGSASKVGSYFTGGILLDVSVSDGVAYSNGNDSILFNIDVTDPSDPQLLSYDHQYRVDTQGVRTQGNYAYVVGHGAVGAGLRVFDITTPSNPSQVGFLARPGIGIFLSGNNAYIASGDTGLQVVDISNPTAPVLISSFDTPGFAQNVFVSNGVAYIADYNNGLQIIDVSNPANPTALGIYDTPGNPTSVFVADNYAFVADSFAGLRVIDVNDPANPTEVGFLDTDSVSHDVKVIDELAYVADSRYVLAIDVSDRTNPVEVGRFDAVQSAYGSANALDIVGNLIYVASVGNGLYILENVTAPPLSDVIEYFALGDSIAAGHGLLDSGPPCHRSDRAYPHQVENLLKEKYQTVNLYFLACSGATARYPGATDEPYKWLANQVDDVIFSLDHIPQDRPVLVSITIGANDFGWSDPDNAVYRLYRQNDKAYFRWVEVTTTTVGIALQFSLNRLLEYPNVSVVLTEVHNPFNENSVFFRFGPNNRCGLVNCYYRLNYAVDSLNTKLIFTDLGSDHPDRVRVTSTIRASFISRASPKPYCGSSSPDVADTWIQYPSDPNSNINPPFPEKVWKAMGLEGDQRKGGDCFHPNNNGALAYAEAVYQEALRLLER